MKRTYSKPLTQQIVVEDALLRATSYAIGTRYNPEDKKLNIDDPVTDMGKVITDQYLKTGDYNPMGEQQLVGAAVFLLILLLSSKIVLYLSIWLITWYL